MRMLYMGGAGPLGSSPINLLQNLFRLLWEWPTGILNVMLFSFVFITDHNQEIKVYDDQLI
jgi:hypothetical protein